MKKWLLLLFFPVALFGQIPNAGLIAFYPFDNNATDRSGNYNNGQIIGGVQPSVDRYGNSCGALHFNGVDAYIEVPNSQSLQSPYNSITVAAWFKMEKNPSLPEQVKWLSLICKGNIPYEDKVVDDNPQYRVQTIQRTDINQSLISVSTAFTKYDDDFRSHLFEFDRWIFYALVYDGNNVQVFQDGNKVWEYPYSKPFSTNNLPMHIAKDIPGSTEYFCGSLDDLRIYNRPLAYSEIQSLFNDKTGSGFTDGFFLAPHENVTASTEKGNCSTHVNYTEPTATVNCGTVDLQLVNGPASGSVFNSGRTVVNYLATASSGKQQMCSFSVTIKDNEPPTINCPANMKVKCEPGKTTALVNYPIPLAKDNCPNVTAELISGIPSNSDFPVGETKMKFRATDNSGNVSDCSFLITVEKETPIVIPVAPTPTPSVTPTLTPSVTTDTWTFKCPQDIVVNNNAGKCGAIVDYTPPTVSGGTGATVSLTEGKERNSMFNVGSTLNRFSAKDATTEKTCSFTVKVLDAENPVITCPADTIIYVSDNENGFAFPYQLPKSTDNCRVESVKMIDGMKSAEVFPLGATNVTYKATDASGNASNCSFTVLVKQQMKEPVAELPQKLNTNLKLGNDTIQYEYSVKSKSCTLTAFIYDDSQEDNDSVSVIFNDKIIVDYQMIKIKDHGMIKRVLNLQPGKSNHLIAKAWNNGTQWINTMRIDIYEGEIENEKRDLKKATPVASKVLHSKPGTAGAIVLKCNN